MKKIRCALFCLCFALYFSACAKPTSENTKLPAYDVTVAETVSSTIPVASVPVEMDNTTETILQIQPLHTELYHPDYTSDEILAYFEEVVLNMEYSDGTGDVHVVQKWLEPIAYYIYGTPTREDLNTLNDLFAQLNGIPGFPGIYPAEDQGLENLSIRFLEPDAFRENFSAVVNGEDANGAVQFWYYTATNELHTARIGCRTDVDQQARNSIVMEEVINALGFSDTVLRPDSIVYQYSDDNVTLSDVDWIILRILYDPLIQCGMDADSCAAVIRELYY